MNYKNWLAGWQGRGAFISCTRVSTQDQTLDLQVDTLERAGCERIYKDMMSGAKTKRPGLHKVLEQLRAGDILGVAVGRNDYL